MNNFKNGKNLSLIQISLKLLIALIPLHNRQRTMFTSYQNQAAIFNRLKNEVIGLYAKVKNIKNSLEYELFL